MLQHMDDEVKHRTSMLDKKSRDVEQAEKELDKRVTRCGAWGAAPTAWAVGVAAC